MQTPDANLSKAFSRRLKDCLISWVRGNTTANAAKVQLNFAAKYCARSVGESDCQAFSSSSTSKGLT